MQFEPFLGASCVVDIAAIAQNRCVGVSDGRLHYVEISDKDDKLMATVSVWTHGRGGWTRRSATRFADVWAHPTYVNNGLPQTVPAIAFVHPSLPNHLYFLLEERLFSVDVSVNRVVEVVGAPQTADLFPWILPSSLTPEYEVEPSKM
ncbi:hypothetical protein E2562_014965 [Oryza meyeriana var. granulata]|uniref:DUF1618 domain-containing protein n=1 Tax=Oryza meyeriana var. granulata TaxID=110450 RepID=A0A6G1EJN2_9ORYZ|nr:hypothetical protein E2562_014965 [Oryza meyeriana var. granulata]